MSNARPKILVAMTEENMDLFRLRLEALGETGAEIVHTAPVDNPAKIPKIQQRIESERPNAVVVFNSNVALAEVYLACLMLLATCERLKIPMIIVDHVKPSASDPLVARGAQYIDLQNTQPAEMAQRITEILQRPRWAPDPGPPAKATP